MSDPSQSNKMHAPTSVPVLEALGLREKIDPSRSYRHDITAPEPPPEGSLDARWPDESA